MKTTNNKNEKRLTSKPLSPKKAAALAAAAVAAGAVGNALALSGPKAAMLAYIPWHPL